MKTLLIVGAGASAEAGLPTGKGLKTDISYRLDIYFEDYKRIRGDGEVCDAIIRWVSYQGGKEDPNSYIKAAWRIRDAMPQALSIDSFIDAHQGDEKIEICGKLAIVSSILEAEKNSLLFVNHKEEIPNINFSQVETTWFNKFWQLLTEGCRKDDVAERLGKVSFIIFNYDRCIEHFLYYALQNYYGIPNDQAADHVNELEIFHPYGTIGCLPWQNKDNAVAYGAEKSGLDLLPLSRQTKTYTERVEDKATIDSMHQLVQDAENVVFLGFAFHRPNMELIKPEQPTAMKQVFATTKGISSSDFQIVRRQIFDLFGQNESERQLKTKDDECRKLFDEYWRSLALS